MVKEGKVQLLWSVLLQSFLDGDEILQTFGHLAFLNCQLAGMKEVGNPFIELIISREKKEAHHHRGRDLPQNNICTMYIVDNIIVF